MRSFLISLAAVGLLALDPARGWAQQQNPRYAVWSDQTTPMNLMPGWPPAQQSRSTRGPFGDRTLGQTLRPKDSPSRFTSGWVRGSSGNFVGIGAKNPPPIFVQSPPQYRPDVQVQTPLAQVQVQAPPAQGQAPTAVPEQPLPKELREQLEP
jgi:hypothetical protein